MSRGIFVTALSLMAVGLAPVARAQGNPPANDSATLFQNVRIFDGKGASLSTPSNVLIKGNINRAHLDRAGRLSDRFTSLVGPSAGLIEKIHDGK